MRLFGLAIVAVLSACVAGPAKPPLPEAARPAAVDPTIDLASISYSTSACFGACPVYAVTVTADGRGTWEGQRHVSAPGERSFPVTREQFTAFATALAADRPDGDRRLVTQAECHDFATDLNGVDIVWTDRLGGRDVLSAYFGCDMEANRVLFGRLKSAVQALPIAVLVGSAGS